MFRLRPLAIALSALACATAIAQTTTPTDSGGTAPHAGHRAHDLKQLDTNGDGRVSLDEYLAGATARYQALDTAHSNAVSAAQIAAAPMAQKRDLHEATALVRHLDTARKGYVTSDDFVSAAQARFARIDTQGTGQFTLAQFQAAPAARFARASLAGNGGGNGTHAGMREKFAQAEFTRLDSNGDGVVTQAEFVAAAKNRFAALDTQHTGKLTAEQIAAAPATEQRNEKFAAHMVKKLDTNGDGSVSLDEFLAGAKARFARLDRNGDGFLDASDRGARSKGGNPSPSS